MRHAMRWGRVGVVTVAILLFTLIAQPASALSVICVRDNVGSVGSWAVALEEQAEVSRSVGLMEGAHSDTASPLQASGAGYETAHTSRSVGLMTGALDDGDPLQEAATQVVSRSVGLMEGAPA